MSVYKGYSSLYIEVEANAPDKARAKLQALENEIADLLKFGLGDKAAVSKVAYHGGLEEATQKRKTGTA